MHPIRIVAADDAPYMIAFYRKALARLGHHVAVAENGRRLVELCSTLRPDLVIESATKWLGGHSDVIAGVVSGRQELIDGVHDNLRNLGLDALDIVNLRVGGIMQPGEESIAEPLTVLAELKRQGLIRHIGVSNITPKQLSEAQTITEIVCVQNFYNVARRNDDAFIHDLAAQGIAYVPFFPLGGFTPLQSSALDASAASLQATPMQVALAWLLHRSPNILLIPGTSSVAHLRENLKAATLQIPAAVLADLDAIGRGQGDQ